MNLEAHTFTTAVVMAALLSAEWILPFYHYFRNRNGARVLHDAKNLTWGLANFMIVAVAFGSGLAGSVHWAQSREIGLIPALSLDGLPATVAALLLFDLWMYVWHRANHAIPLLWRLHVMHHSDPHLNATTAVRFHTGEILLSTLCRLFVVPLIGMRLWDFALYKAIFLPIVFFHHANLTLPRWLDRNLIAFVVPPAMHRVHHSQIQEDANSNFGAILPHWDMLFASFRLREDVRKLAFGVPVLAIAARRGARSHPAAVSPR